MKTRNTQESLKKQIKDINMKNNEIKQKTQKN